MRRFPSVLRVYGDARLDILLRGHTEIVAFFEMRVAGVLPTADPAMACLVVGHMQRPNYPRWRVKDVRVKQR